MASVTGTSSLLRFSGLSTGMDIDSMVEQLMKVERTKLDKVKQDKQLLEWKRDDYRSITNTLRAFKDKYFDVLSASYMKSSRAYKAFSSTVNAQNPNLDTGAVAVSADSTAAAGTHSLVVKQLATSQTVKSVSGITKDVAGNGAYTLNAGEKFNLTVDGVTKSITLTGSSIDSLNTAIANAFGSGKVTVDSTTNPGVLTFKASNSTNGVNQISVSAASSSNALANMGFGANASFTNRLSGSDSLETVSKKLDSAITFTTLSDGVTQGISLSINGKNFEFSKSTSLSVMMSKINTDATANVNMQYDSIKDEFKVTAKQQGAGENIALSETGSNFLSAAAMTVNTQGQDAQFILDGSSITRSGNTFTVSGVTYTAYKVTTDGVTDRSVAVTVSQDVDTVYNKIKSFVDDYNKLIDTLNSEYTEKRDTDYMPLTDDQKEEMEDSDIDSWEEKAKAGMLRNDSILGKIISGLRSTLYEEIKDVSGSLYTIGIKTGTWDQKGKLVIDETKLKEAISNDPDKVMNILAKESSISYSAKMTSEQKAARFDENGIIARLSDVIEDNIRTSRDNNNKKGTLLEKAGISRDASDTVNTMFNLIKDKDDLIDSLLVKLTDKEENYYERFTAMEKAINQMNTQIAWMSQ
ncbi:MAG TPA: flagellar filament capping protein FliD, partial [Negativicutes bacterium]|nr:flagellar filament capping protein FliD [Negativicutes bacterium]